jgi:hypothetical protein
MITTEFLNAVPGRPKWLREWVGGSTPDDKFWYCQRTDKIRFSVYINEEGQAFIGESNLRAAECLDLATYACRVEKIIDAHLHPKPPTCNLHKDCGLADKESMGKHGKRAYHCSISDCDDCFGQ